MTERTLVLVKPDGVRRGLIVRPMAHLVILSPPLIISRGQIDEMADILHASILAVADELRQEGLWS